MNTTLIDNIFGKTIVLPDGDLDERLEKLVGVEDAIHRLGTMLEMLIFPDSFEEWKEKHHPKAKRLFDYTKRRHPLIILAGDVGTGKTELSETIGSPIARKHKVEITLFPLNLSSRGSGLVGEMTNLITYAFSYVEKEASSIAKDKCGKYKSGIILQIDEADALAQSRDASQMHHEDKAGVNALIRGIDSINRRSMPVAVIMCTNRLSAIDPAIIRRASEVISFTRPTYEQRLMLLKSCLEELDFTDGQIEDIAKITGETEKRRYGFTYSDITQKLFHSLIMACFPKQPICYDQTIEIIKKINPTPPFRDGVSDV